MAFSIRKMLSNIYYKKSEDEGSTGDQTDECKTKSTALKKRRHQSLLPTPETGGLEKTEPDSTSIQKKIIPQSTRNLSKKSSSSDTDLKAPESPKRTRKTKKLKLDVNKANKSSKSFNLTNDEESSSMNVEITPKHVLLGPKFSENFTARLREYDLNKSFDIFDAMSEGRPSSPEENLDIESLSEHSDTESLTSELDENEDVKMCRKVNTIYNSTTSITDNILRSITPESFGEIDFDKTEDERIALLQSYQIKMDKMERCLKKILTEFQFHIEVSKVFQSRSVLTMIPDSNFSDLPEGFGEIKCIENAKTGPSPTEGLNIIMERDDKLSKAKLRKQLMSMKHFMEEFANNYLNHLNQEPNEVKGAEFEGKTGRYLNQKSNSLTYSVDTGKVPKKHLRINNKKKYKLVIDVPDLKDAFYNLFEIQLEQNDVFEENDLMKPKCSCKCMYHRSSSPDSGLKTTDDEFPVSQSITSSIGNFSLDSSTLTAYSESLEQNISYNSFQDSSLYCTLLQKVAVERITFYVQVHSIQLLSNNNDSDFESKNNIKFYCPSCCETETEEQGLLKHILSQKHCEKIHFLYKTAYIKKCMSTCKEIQPSTVLNPMTLYRDDNKIVCFGDAAYACSLCFEKTIIGESVLMAHCSDKNHIDRRERLCEILE